MLRAIADIDGIEKNAPAAPARATAVQRRTPIASEPIPTVTPPPISAAAEASGERRYVTVMFCDLVGSTSISAQLDAEEWRDLVGGYLDAACAAVTEMGGHVAKKLGDGLMVLFGYPVAQENDAERAARAALSIQQALAEVNRKNAEAGKPALNARIGIETGAVVIDAAGEVYGDAPNVAARVQANRGPRSRDRPRRHAAKGAPNDEIRRIKSGARGADVLEPVSDKGPVVANIFWERKAGYASFS
jgi:class 3 adenylate cyclase